MRALINQSPGELRGDSSPVRSSQLGRHPRLEPVVLRHLRCPWRQPLHRPSVGAFRALQGLLDGGETDTLVLDSGCGTGESTVHLAGRYPDSVVVGIDRSAARLSGWGADVQPVRRGSAIWMRSELATFWRLALEAGWRVRAHFLLYPNPWPKTRHLMRRWHAHPVFPGLLALGGDLVMRTNWDLYAQEFAHAVRLATGRAARVRVAEIAEPLSPFERKYALSGHRLYETALSLPDPGSGARNPVSRRA